MGMKGVQEMRYEACALCALSAIAAPVSGQGQLQEQLVISVNEVSQGSWEVYGELQNPQSVIDAAIWDLHFLLEGSNLSNFSYNTAFDSDFFGPPEIMLSPTSIEFEGINPGGPLRNADGPDSSNPLFLVSFNADSVSDFELVGQNSGSYVGTPTFPFGILFLYQNANGSPGTVPFQIEVNPIPTSGTCAVAGLVGLQLLRRRRSPA
ncbi:MAG: hypothetical protein KDA31_04820 [Phycisphaerales bacterium]|nr:hypothetical protein [Phycisphaerales bacterium]